jgi:hypothetical protein
MTMEAKALAGGKADYPNAGALVLRRGANAWVRVLALALELGSDVCRPLRLFLFIGRPIDHAQGHGNSSNVGSSIGYLNKLFRWLLLGQPSQRQFGNVVMSALPPKADMCSARGNVR